MEQQPLLKEPTRFCTNAKKDHIIRVGDVTIRVVRLLRTYARIVIEAPREMDIKIEKPKGHYRDGDD